MTTTEIEYLSDAGDDESMIALSISIVSPL